MRCVPEEWSSRPLWRGQNPAYRLSGLFSAVRNRPANYLKARASPWNAPQGCSQERNANIFVIWICREMDSGLSRVSVDEPGDFRAILQKEPIPLTSQVLPCYPTAAHRGPSSTGAYDWMRSLVAVPQPGRHRALFAHHRTRQHERHTGPNGAFYRHPPEQAGRQGACVDTSAISFRTQEDEPCGRRRRGRNRLPASVASERMHRGLDGIRFRGAERTRWSKATICSVRNTRIW